MIFKTATNPSYHIRAEYPIPPPSSKMPITNYGHQLIKEKGREFGENNSGEAGGISLLKDDVGYNYYISGGSMASLQETSSDSSRCASSSKGEGSVSPSTSVGSRGVFTGTHIDSRSDVEDVASKTNLNIFNFENNQESYLQLLEPYPVLPPTYNSLPPGGCPRYPIISETRPDELPEYTPAVYKLCVATRKVEWMSPYEPSPSRAWKHVIIELNSTQLNIYSIPSGSESELMVFQQMLSSKFPPKPRRVNDALDFSYSSRFTNESDLQLREFCLGLGLIDVLPGDSLMNNNIGEDQGKMNKHKKKLLRSYSLQHTKIGLASDYKKKENVLRLRIENEQILINFSSVKDLIEWNNGLNVGKDVSIDIEERDIPKYRTVPRRRRRNRNITRIRSGSDPSPYSGVKGKIRRLKSKLPFTVDHKESTGYLNGRHKNTNHGFVRSHSFSNFSLNSLNETLESLVDEEDVNDTREFGSPARSESLGISLNEPNENDDRNAEGEDEDDDEEDINNVSDLHASDFDDDDDFPEELDAENNDACFGTRSRRGTVPSLWFEGDIKWHPSTDKTPTERKIYRNCLRCIKTLSFDEPWVNKVLVKPVNITPISFHYYQSLRQWQNPSSRESSISSMSTFNSTFSGIQVSHTRKRSLSFKDLNGLNFYDALSLTPNHNLKEFIVGMNGLIPKGIQN